MTRSGLPDPWLLLPLTMRAAYDGHGAAAIADLAVPPDMGAACGDPAAPPTLHCGTLAWAKSPLTSRKRNHHVTLAINTAAGPFLYVLGGVEGKTGVLWEVDR